MKALANDPKALKVIGRLQYATVIAAGAKHGTRVVCSSLWLLPPDPEGPPGRQKPWLRAFAGIALPVFDLHVVDSTFEIEDAETGKPIDGSEEISARQIWLVFADGTKVLVEADPGMPGIHIAERKSFGLLWQIHERLMELVS